MIRNSLENLLLTLYLLSPQVEERQLPLSKVRKIDDEAVIFSEAVCLGKVTDSIAIKCFSPPFFAGSSALWPGKLALPRTTCVTCLPSTILSSPPALLSTLSLK